MCILMVIEAQQAGVRYGYTWIFRGFTYSFQSGQTYALLGNNGSGKSTLLQILAGSKVPTEGKVTYQQNGKPVAAEDIHRHIGLVAPYLGLPEELTVEELLQFHSRFRQPLLSIDAILERIWLKGDKRKEIRQLSSGMKQRLKLGMAFFFESEMLLLDEPTSHLDVHGIGWYKALAEEARNGRMLIVASNQEHEYETITHRLEVRNWKPEPRKKAKA